MIKKDKDIYKNIHCSLIKGTEVTNKNNSKGTIVCYNRERRIIYVKDDSKNDQVKYKYPEAFLKGFLNLEDKYLNLVKRDIRRMG